MELGIALLLLCAGLLPQGRGQNLEVEPPEPEVAVALGGSQQLTCRLTCPDGRTASVQWRGLDTSPGSVQSAAGRSVLSVQNASLAAAGARLCVGSCGRSTLQRTVQLLVYAFPDELSVSPVALVPGTHRKVACTAHSITPVDPNFLTFSLLLEEQELEGAAPLGWDVEPLEGEEPLYLVTESWLLPPLGTLVPPQLHCRITMHLPGLELSHQRTIPILHHLDTLKPSTLATPKHSTSIFLEHPASTSPETPITTSLELPTLTSPEQSSNPDPCHPEIHQPPSLPKRKAPWELLCEVACGSQDVAVHWTQAPGGLEVYEQLEMGAQAWLRLQQAGYVPRGWFQCRMDPGGKVAKLFLNGTSPPDDVQPSAGLWTGTLVLGLLLLAFLAWRLRRCFRSER